MKKKQLTPEQFQQLLIATANLPFIRQQRQPTSYLSDVLETVLNFQMQEPVVVKALKYFDHNVQHEHDIHNHEQLQDALNFLRTLSPAALAPPGQGASPLAMAVPVA